MTISINPFAVNLSNNANPEYEKGEKYPWVIYWGIYLNDKQISYTSSKESAEETKLWMEKWLQDKL